MIEVSVVISVYNDKEYLEECVESLLNQDFENYEIVLIDDGSSDGSREIIQNYTSKDKIKTILNQKNIGLTKSLNKGIDAAEGKYIARQDADDLSQPERLKEQAEFLDNNENIFLVGQDNRTDCLLDKEGDVVREYEETPKREVKGDDLLEENIIRHSSIMFRNNGIKYREKFYYAQDRDLYFRILSNGDRIMLLGKNLVKGRIHPGNINSSKSHKQEKFVEKAEEFYKQRIRKGEDEYEEFVTDSIVEKEDNQYPRKHYNIKKIRRSLDSGNPEKARAAFKNLRQCEGVSWKEELKYNIATKLPVFYKARKKFGSLL